ncbi:MAG: hypothetical protein JSV12_05285 [Candidatus Bathyarchaeota archaeon]|nr:MAG: hypothetical protein JSV12_05285 [Candidatus Bathyarchaeota archaeon]
MTATERRLELLKMEGIGFNQAEIVKDPSQKHSLSNRTIYCAFENRANW